ncbi:hypothetical protein VITU102760_18105 [Vibrio tubiashii]|uniref:Uncharacterized protein n=1 Tax=Vibrio tubiashii ATCC 19109 TaxID=1051646 RepID=F9SZL3_9VIBR|nr:hypothetical protein [Vibrio tubiashii]AIW12998.1 hypothetical protein IX91_02065 [Vibrio tubiashii ATCC 19109]EGU59193.1 hypothetical protein VITU9109_25730 [Vibrio tubiashii ATCC 19109]EIF05283.1 hypothetical protein VT1337_04255 [Vibrio tubiashii NCIMB 1337 = ATCC 19106]
MDFNWFLEHLFPILGGFLGGYILLKLQHKTQKIKREISVHCNAIQLFDVHEQAPKELKVILAQPENSKDEKVGRDNEVDGACAHSLKIKNRGNTETDEVFIDISFEPDVEIISFSCDGVGNPEYKMSIEKKDSEPNTLKVYLPYLNDEEVIDVSVLTAGKNAAKEPEITGQGKGVKVSIYRPKIPWVYGLLALSSLTPIQFFWTGFPVQSVDFIVGPLSTNLVERAGGIITQQTTYLATFPLLLSFIYIFVFAFLAYIFAKKAYLSLKF